MTSQHKDPISRHNHLTSDCRNMPPYEVHDHDFLFYTFVQNLGLLECKHINICARFYSGGVVH